MSVAPEIAILAAAALLVPAQQAARAPEGPRLTLGTLARHLRTLAASPERWWGLVRFSPDRSVQIKVEARPGYEAWLVVMPPGDVGRDCDCDAATLIAGEATEATEATKGAPGRAVLRPGVTRVHGQRHRLRGHGAGYSISLHARATPNVLRKVRVIQEPKDAARATCTDCSRRPRRPALAAGLA